MVMGVVAGCGGLWWGEVEREEWGGERFLGVARGGVSEMFCWGFAESIVG